MGLDVIDFTDLQKRGLLKTEKVEQTPDTIDFTVSNEQGSYFNDSQSTSSSTATNDQSNPFDMLSSLAQVGESNQAGNNSHSTHNTSDVHLKLDTIVNKLEDAMYKIETMSSRIVMLESKLDSLKSFRN